MDFFLILRLGLINLLHHDSDTIYGKREYSAGQEHCHVRHNQLDVVLRGDVPVPDRHHCHGSPVERVKVESEGGGVGEFIKIDPICLIRVLVGGSEPNTGKNMANQHDLYHQFNQTHYFPIESLRIQQPQ